MINALIHEPKIIHKSPKVRKQTNDKYYNRQEKIRQAEEVKKATEELGRSWRLIGKWLVDKWVENACRPTPLWISSNNQGQNLYLGFLDAGSQTLCFFYWATRILPNHPFSSEDWLLITGASPIEVIQKIMKRNFISKHQDLLDDIVFALSQNDIEETQDELLHVLQWS